MAMIARVSAHLNTLYAALPPLQRFEAARRDGFQCVEFWAPPDDAAAEPVLGALARHDLQLASVNTPPGPRADDFGQLGDPDAVAWWRADFTRTLTFSRRAGAQAINVLAGGRIPSASRAAQVDTMLVNLDWALGQLSMGDPVLLLEPLNGADRRSPLLRNVGDVLSLISMLGGPPRLRLLFDAYHLFQEEADLLTALRAAGEVIGHVQIADFPGRNEPGSGEIPFSALLAEIERSGYPGWIGLEYFPSGHQGSLDWLDLMEAP
jgi:hydroxypyruvate isomerase